MATVEGVLAHGSRHTAKHLVVETEQSTRGAREAVLRRVGWTAQYRWGCRAVVETEDAWGEWVERR
jgi:hypothetical protein